MENFISGAGTFGLKILIALVIFFIGQKFANIFVEYSVKALKKSGIDETLEKFMRSVLYGVFIVLMALIALSQIGIETTSIAAMLGAVGLAIGLAFKDSLSNISAGIMIIVFKPLKVGEFVEAGGASGTVEEINIFNTILKTGDNKIIIISNSSVIAANIVNYSRNATRRVDFNFLLNYDNDLRLAKSILIRICDEDEKILKEPAIFVGVGALSETGINLTLRVWTKSEFYWDVFHFLNETIKENFEQNKITLAQSHTGLQSPK